MKIKLGPTEIHLRRVAKVTRAADNTAKITMLTGEAILLRCSVFYPDGIRFTYRGTVEALKVLIDTQKDRR